MLLYGLLRFRLDTHKNRVVYTEQLKASYVKVECSFGWVGFWIGPRGTQSLHATRNCKYRFSQHANGPHLIL